MPVPSTQPVAPISPGEMQLLLSRAGLILNPGQVADLVLAWRQVAGLIASLPRDRPLADDMAQVFRLSPPAAAAASLAPAPAKPKRTAPAPKRKTPTPKAKAKAKGKSAAKKRPPARKQARRRR